MVNLLHVAQGFFEVQSVSMAATKSVSQLLAKTWDISLTSNSQLSLHLVLVSQHHVLIVTDWFRLVWDELPQNNEFLFQLNIFVSFQFCLELELVSLPLKRFDLQNHFISRWSDRNRLNEWPSQEWSRWRISLESWLRIRWHVTPRWPQWRPGHSLFCSIQVSIRGIGCGSSLVSFSLRT